MLKWVHRRAPRNTALPGVLALAALCSACNTAPPAAEGGDGPVVTRTAANTVWASPEAVEAARQAAAQAAAEREARARADAAAREARAAAASAAASAASAQAASAPTAQVIGTGTMAVEPLQRVVYFDYDSFALRPEAQPMVERRARAMLNQPHGKLLLEGHADERGGSEYNLALGQKRAEAVLRALAVLGVPVERMEATSFGSTRPAVQGRDEQAWSQNRRVEIKALQP